MMLSHSNINNVYVNKTHHVIPFKKRYKARRKFITCSVINFLLTVGMTRLELATTRPPDAYATNCATSRTCFRFSECKDNQFSRNLQIYHSLFPLILIIYPYIIKICFAITVLFSTFARLSKPRKQ